MTQNTFLITGASDGIGAVYAERLAKRGHDLILVARRAEKLKALAAQLEKDHHIAVEVLSADLSRAEDLEKVEVRLREDRRITGLVNNAGIAGEGAITALDPAYVTTMINLNILAVTRLAAAIAPRLAADGRGTIINITSVTALMPAAFTAVYPATKASCLPSPRRCRRSFRPPVCGFRPSCRASPARRSGKRNGSKPFRPPWSWMFTTWWMRPLPVSTSAKR